MRTRLQVIGSFLLAVVVAGLLGSILQTQVNLAQLRDIGPPISFAMRVDSTWHDLLRFAPIYTMIVLAPFIIAIPIAEFIAKKVPGHRMIWLVAAAAGGLWVCFQLINHVAPMPTFIAATRTLGGTLLLLLAAAIAAVLYTLITPQLNTSSDVPENSQESE